MQFLQQNYLCTLPLSCQRLSLTEENNYSQHHVCIHCKVDKVLYVQFYKFVDVFLNLFFHDASLSFLAVIHLMRFPFRLTHILILVFATIGQPIFKNKDKILHMYQRKLCEKKRVTLYMVFFNRFVIVILDILVFIFIKISFPS